MRYDAETELYWMSVRMTDSERDALNIYPSKGKVIFFGLAMGIWIPAGLFTALVTGASLIQILIGIAAVAMSAWYLILGCLPDLISSTPILRADQEGLWLNWRPAAVGLIRWAEVETLAVDRGLGNWRLMIYLADPQPVIERQAAWKRLALYALMRKMSRSRTAVANDGLLPVSMLAVIDEIQSRFHHEIAHYHIRVVSPKS